MDEKLVQSLEKIERLLEEKKAIDADINSIKKELKSEGYIDSYINYVLGLRQKDKDEVYEMLSLQEKYRKIAGIES